MSAYSDWKSGALSDDEYKQAYRMERGEDHGEIPFYYNDVIEDEDTEDLENDRIIKAGY